MSRKTRIAANRPGKTGKKTTRPQLKRDLPVTAFVMTGWPDTTREELDRMMCGLAQFLREHVGN
jgi:hypothetical protein